MRKKTPVGSGFNFNEAFQTNITKELEGAWTTISIGGNDLHIMLARKDNSRATSYLRELLKVNEVALKPDDEKANDLFLELRKKVMARCIILDWKDLSIDNQIQPYSEEICLKLLKFNDFYNQVDFSSADFAIFRADQNEKILKN